MRIYFWGVCALWVAIISLANCKGWDDVNPETTKSTPDYPCGILWVACAGPDGGFNHTCCKQNETCPDSLGCLPGVCCNIAPFNPSYFGASQGDAGVLPAPTNGHLAASDGGLVWVKSVEPVTHVP
jgi:hypothetical protein